MTPCIVAGSVGETVDLLVLADDRRFCFELTLPQAERALAELAHAVAEARRVVAVQGWRGG